MVSLIPGAKPRPEFSPFLKFCDKCRVSTVKNLTSDIKLICVKKDLKVQNDVIMSRYNNKVS